MGPLNSLDFIGHLDAALADHLEHFIVDLDLCDVYGIPIHFLLFELALDVELLDFLVFFVVGAIPDEI